MRFSTCKFHAEKYQNHNICSKIWTLNWLMYQQKPFTEETVIPSMSLSTICVLSLRLSRHVRAFIVQTSSFYTRSLTAGWLPLFCHCTAGTVERFDWTNNYKQDGRPTEGIWFGCHQPEGGRHREGELFDPWLGCCSDRDDTRRNQQCISIFIHTRLFFWDCDPVRLLL